MTLIVLKNTWMQKFKYRDLMILALRTTFIGTWRIHKKLTGLLQEISERNEKIDDILKTPILLNMVCSLFEGPNPVLPSTKCQLIGCIVQRCINREAIRAGRPKVIKNTNVFSIDSWPADIRIAFLELGKLAFEKLNEPEQNLMFDKVR